MLLHRDREVRAPLDGCIVGYDHALSTVNTTNAGDDSGAGRFIAIHSGGGKGAEFQKGGAGIQQLLDTLSRQKLSPLLMLGDGFRATALHRLL